MSHSMVYIRADKYVYRTADTGYSPDFEHWDSGTIAIRLASWIPKWAVLLMARVRGW